MFNSTGMFAQWGVFQNIKLGFVNEIARLVLIVACAMLSSRAPILFANILKVTDIFTEGASTYANIKNTVSQVGDVGSGQLFIDKSIEAKNTVKQLIPGFALATTLADKAKEISDGVSISRVQKRLQEQGVSESAIKKMTKELSDRMIDKKAFKANNQQKDAFERTLRESKREFSQSLDKKQEKAIKDRIKKIEKNQAEIAARKKKRKAERNSSNKK